VSIAVVHVFSGIDRQGYDVTVSGASIIEMSSWSARRVLGGGSSNSPASSLGRIVCYPGSTCTCSHAGMTSYILHGTSLG
jgi:hypothetical protein